MVLQSIWWLELFLRQYFDLNLIAINLYLEKLKFLRSFDKARPAGLSIQLYLVLINHRMHKLLTKKLNDIIFIEYNEFLNNNYKVPCDICVYNQPKYIKMKILKTILKIINRFQ